MKKAVSEKNRQNGFAAAKRHNYTIPTTYRATNFKLENLMEEPWQNHVRGIEKVIEELRERLDISYNRLSSSTALPNPVAKAESDEIYLNRRI